MKNIFDSHFINVVKLMFIGLTLLIYEHNLYGQNNSKELYLNISCGRVLFGTGDVVGYSISTEFSKKIITSPKNFVRKILLSGELAFETGVKTPKVIDIFPSDLYGVTFYHISNTLFTLKVTYYPITRTFLKGLNIAIGPTIGYTNQSREWRADYNPYTSTSGTGLRSSYLEYKNSILWGYKISAGYEYKFKKSLLIGIRADFNNYANGDINTLAALKFGYGLK